jgi:hypothetical protein
MADQSFLPVSSRNGDVPGETRQQFHINNAECCFWHKEDIAIALIDVRFRG